MASIRKLTYNGEDFYPVTSSDAIYFSDGTTLTSHLSEIEQFNALVTRYQDLDTSIRDALMAKLDGAGVDYPVGLSIDQLLGYFSTASSGGSGGGSTGGSMNNTGTRVRTLNNGEQYYDADVELINSSSYIDCGSSYTSSKTLVIMGYYGSMFLMFRSSMIYGTGSTPITYNIVVKSSSGSVIKNITHTSTIGSTVTNSFSSDFDNAATVTITATIDSSAHTDTNVYVYLDAYAMRA